MSETPMDGQPGLRRQVVMVAARILGVTILLMVAYFRAPIGPKLSSTDFVVFFLALVAFCVALGFQVRRIMNDPTPRLRAIETLGIAIPCFLVIFAVTYVALAQNDPTNFNQPITRLSALYFTVTVLSTTGFGDIVATTDTARAFVTVQMMLDLLLIGIIVKVILGATRIGLERRQAGSPPAPGPGSATAGADDVM